MRFILTSILLFFSIIVFSQTKIDSVLKAQNNENVSYISPNVLSKTNNIILLDTRKKEEYNVSHLKDALWVGYKSFNLEAVLSKIPDKNTNIVVYCSIGVRSEDIGEKLIKAGYLNVKNLYGGIFEWKNIGNTVYDSKGNETEKIHVFSKHWGKLLIHGDKVY